MYKNNFPPTKMNDKEDMTLGREAAMLAPSGEQSGVFWVG